MIDPIKNTFFPPSIGNTQFSHEYLSLHLQSDICSIAKKNPLSKKITHILSIILDWIKTYLLFWFFDNEQEKNDKLDLQLKKYIDVFFSLSKDPSPSVLKTLIRNFSKLDNELKNQIKKTIIDILRSAYPERSEKAYEKKVKEVIENPFLRIKDANKPKEEQNISIMAAAILDLQINRFKGLAND